VEEMPSLNMLVHRLKVAILPLDLPCSGLVTHSGEILTTGKSHGKKPDRFSLNDDTNVKKVSRFKYATWNVRGLGEKEEELDTILNKNNINTSSPRGVLILRDLSRHQSGRNISTPRFS
jgi:hypothetical protein